MIDMAGTLIIAVCLRKQERGKHLNRCKTQTAEYTHVRAALVSSGWLHESSTAIFNSSAVIMQLLSRPMQSHADALQLLHLPSNSL
jgi:hypothetical protein